ncbi:MAG: AAA family ATPase [Photobacterium frigidiphilum]|uniref:AAA family ATPase n=1 Tax=Photobacterium frigidiphilum TaxID=264736 RepID=UPI0030014504
MTPTEQIINWTNDTRRPIWWRHAVRLALEKVKLNNDDYNLLINIALMQSGLAPKTPEYELYKKPIPPMANQAKNESVILESISDVVNIGALQPNQTLNFSPEGITVIYGDNGSGKSSYTRVLKNACLTRGDKPVVIGNAFNGCKDEPAATLNINISGVKDSVKWTRNIKDNNNLKSIRVFDSSSSQHYINKEDNLDFNLSGMSLLDELIKACKHIKIEFEKYKYPVVSLPIISFPTKNKISDSYQSISSKTKSLEFKKTIEFDVDALKAKKELLAELTSKSPEKLKQHFSHQHSLLKPLFEELTRSTRLLNDDAALQIKSLSDEYKTAEFALNQITKSTFENLPYCEIGTQTWKSMWDSAMTFIQSSGNQVPLKNGDTCPLCLQGIGNESALRLEHFYSFLSGDAQKKRDASYKKLNSLINPLKTLNINKESHQGIISNLASTKRVISDAFNDYFDNLSYRKSALTNKEPTYNFNKIDDRCIIWLDKQMKSLVEKIAAVKDDNNLRLLISKTTEEIALLESIKLIQPQLGVIENRINYLLYVERIDSLLKETNISSITRLNSDISQSSFIGLLKKEFSEQLNKLGFKRYEIIAKTRGSSGQQMLKFEINSIGSNLSTIASEGEQKCIALAGFLAELKIDDRNSSVIFDDPINSLDHHWRRKFSKRIVEESKFRQIIIFSHDLAFLKMLEDSSDTTIALHAVDRMGKNVGVCSDNPPWDATKTEKRIGLLKQDLVKIQKSFRLNNIEEVRERTRTFYSKKRETWERLVEEWLIFGIVERFGRDVQTQKNFHLLDTTEEDIQTIKEGMDTCCKYLGGHDKASGLGIEYPDADEIQEDLDKLEQQFKLLKYKRNKKRK